MELLYPYWICLPLRRLQGGLWLQKLTSSACYGAMLMETSWASMVRFTDTKYLNGWPSSDGRGLEQVEDCHPCRHKPFCQTGMSQHQLLDSLDFLTFQLSLVLKQALSGTSLTRFWSWLAILKKGHISAALLFDNIRVLTRFYVADQSECLY